MPLVDVLIPTYRRKTGLVAVLVSLLGQTFQDFSVIVSDQTPEDEVYLESAEVDTAKGALEWDGHEVRMFRNLPQQGLAQQRDFLLRQSSAKYVHFVDDDVVLNRLVLQRMVDTIETEECGFVGCAATGLGFLGDEREHEQQVELWDGRVQPECIGPESVPWDRHTVNNAANPLHLERKLTRGETLRYKVAWIGGANVLFDRAKLLSVGGFSWWRRLPPGHAGEEVLPQLLLLRHFGGCGILPSGTYHMGLPTTVTDRACNATELFGQLIDELEHGRVHTQSHSASALRLDPGFSSPA